MLFKLMAGGMLLTVVMMMLSPLQREKERVDYANLQIKNLKVLIASAQKRMDKELEVFAAHAVKFTEMSDAMITHLTLAMSAAHKQRFMTEMGAAIATTAALQVKVQRCSKASTDRYESAKSVMRAAVSKSGIDNAFTSTQALLKGDIDCVKEASATVAQLAEKLHL
ncbi:MAG: hypothetical protein OYH77_07770 [Pseudomonadota bacterium]|nr:hypothetical protein [Pseudomonadota bacterium]